MIVDDKQAEREREREKRSDPLIARPRLKSSTSFFLDCVFCYWVFLVFCSILLGVTEVYCFCWV